MPVSAFHDRCGPWAGLVALLAIASAAGFAASQSPTDAAALAQQGATALAERRFPEALEAFEAAAARRPKDATLPFGAGLAAQMMARDAEAETLFRRALALQPAFLEASLQLGELQYRNGRLAEAIDTYQAALSKRPKDRALVTRLEAWQAEARLQGRFNEQRAVHFRVLFEGPEDEAFARRVLDLLERHYSRIGNAWHWYPDGSIDVVLYTQQQFRDVTRAPSWAGAVYDGRIRLPTRGADRRVDDLDRVLAHEFVHALVTRLGGPTVPAWIHEGLATVFESMTSVDDARALVARSGATLPLDALEDGFEQMSAAQAQLAYATAAIAVQRMLALRGPQGMVVLLRDLATGVPVSTAFAQRIGVPYAEFKASIR